MISTLFLFLFHFANADTGTSLDVLSISYEDLTDGPSCLLLKHREREREKIIREYLELYGQNVSHSLKTFLLMNQLTTNKDFFDWETLTEETIQVQLTLQLTKELQAEIQYAGLSQAFLSIKARGISWIGYIASLPKSLHIEITKSNTLKINYAIYRSHFCGYPKIQTPQVLISFDLPPMGIGG